MTFSVFSVWLFFYLFVAEHRTYDHQLFGWMMRHCGVVWRKLCEVNWRDVSSDNGDTIEGLPLFVIKIGLTAMRLDQKGPALRLFAPKKKRNATCAFFSGEGIDDGYNVQHVSRRVLRPGNDG